MGERVEAQKRARATPSKAREDVLPHPNGLIGGGIPAVPKIYNWSALGLAVGDGDPAAVLSLPRPTAAATPAETTVHPSSQDVALEQRLLQELESLTAEHSDINEISDRLGQQEMGGAGAIHLVSQRAALKKRKLKLKDQMSSIATQLARLRGKVSEADEADEEYSSDSGDSGASADAEESEDDERDTEQGSLDMLMARLRELGLRPDSIPPHKDSFFLALMKGLQMAGLRPQKYDFRESSVMGSDSQFPWAAKRARQDVMSLLSSQAHKLNGIGGWKLSAAEFKRYFSAAWWHVAAARHDLFMASAHLYSVRIVCLSIVEHNGVYDMVEEIFDPPIRTQTRATITVCRRGAHVISTSPAKTLADPLVVFAPVSQVGRSIAACAEYSLPSVR